MHRGLASSVLVWFYSALCGHATIEAATIAPRKSSLNLVHRVSVFWGPDKGHTCRAVAPIQTLVDDPNRRGVNKEVADQASISCPSLDRLHTARSQHGEQAVTPP